MKKAVLLLSGGLDSAVVLAKAAADNYDVYALSLDYAQRHRVELQAAKRLAVQYGVVEHRIVNLDIDQFGGSALTDHNIAVPTYDAIVGFKSTYVPARNTIFLAIALGYAETIGANTIMLGSCQTDAANFPDDSPDYFRAFEQLANLATRAGREGQHFQIYNPLVNLTKAQTIQLGIALDVDFAITSSCYRPDEVGGACGQCDACGLRKLGFQQAGVVDPTCYQAGVI